MSFNARRIVALAAVLLASTCGGLFKVTFFDPRVFPTLSVVIGAVARAVLVMVWSSRGS